MRLLALTRGLLICCMLVAMSGSLEATRTRQTDVSCPVCGQKTTAVSISSTNSFGGQDTDLLVRARGTQSLLVAPITCFGCAYSGFLNEFVPENASAPTAGAIPEAVCQAIKDGNALKPMMPLPASGSYLAVPAYVRYDLIAQVYQLLGKAEKQICSQYQNAAWTCRLDSAFYRDRLASDTIFALEDFLKSGFKDKGTEADIRFDGNLALIEVEVAEGFLAQAKTASGGQALVPALAAFLLLRGHGENPAAQEAFQILKPLLATGEASIWDAHLTEELARERGFQTKVVAALEKIAESEGNSAEKLLLRFRIADLYRRLGQWDKAREGFGKVQETASPTSDLRIFIEFSEKRLPPP